MNLALPRLAKLADAPELARLSGQLGYASELEEMRARLRRISSDASQRVWVLSAHETGRSLTGWIHAHAMQALESEFRVEIVGLVVDEAQRRNGVGKRLVSAVETWAREVGVNVVSVRCQIKREESHRFYEALGFAKAKMQHVFRKRL